RGTPEYNQALTALSRRGDADLERVEPAVRAILAEVREHGDEAIFALTERFEGRRQPSIVLSAEDVRRGAAEAPAAVRRRLEEAAARIRAYHEHQRDPGFRFEQEGVSLGMRVSP